MNNFQKEDFDLVFVTKEKKFWSNKREIIAKTTCSGRSNQYTVQCRPWNGGCYLEAAR